MKRNLAKIAESPFFSFVAGAVWGAALGALTGLIGSLMFGPHDGSGLMATIYSSPLGEIAAALVGLLIGALVGIAIGGLEGFFASFAAFKYARQGSDLPPFIRRLTLVYVTVNVIVSYGLASAFVNIGTSGHATPWLVLWPVIAAAVATFVAIRLFGWVHESDWKMMAESEEQIIDLVDPTAVTANHEMIEEDEEIPSRR